MATTRQIISPLDIATKGRLSRAPITIATRGYIVYVTEDIVVPEPEPEIPEGAGGGPGARRRKKPEPVKPKKIITATIYIGNETVISVAETEDLNLRLEDVKVEVIETGDKPEIKIIIPPEVK